MLDHVFTDAIDALRQSLEKALLERLAVEEHLTSEVLLGDLTFETSYGLPGESRPARIKADISLQWSTWSQAAFRDWYNDGVMADMAPSVEIEITLRVAELASEPDIAVLYGATSAQGAQLGGDRLFRTGPKLERSFDPKLETTWHAVEIGYGGGYELDEDSLEDSSHIDVAFAELGTWLASILVKLNDLSLDYLPRDGAERG